MTRMRVVAAILLLVAATACSSRGTRATSKPPPSTAALETAFRSYQGDYLNGDGVRAYDVVSTRCKRRVSLYTTIEQAHRYEAFFKDRDTTITDVQIHRRPSDALTATITYTMGATPVPYPDRWIVEDGQWRHDTC